MSTGTVIVMLLVIVAVAAAIFLYMQQRSKRLHAKYGPEYDRLAQDFGSTRRAESDLERREKRLEKIHIRPLTNEERRRFAEAWRETQAAFVDNPATAVARADAIVGDLMSTRGYPMGDFEQRAEDVSVDHPRVVQNYRAAHAIAVRQERGQANTEDLRGAMVHYRALFEDLLEQPVIAHEEVRR